ncbi:MAG: RNA polymerase sigma factor [Planctomycetota bacterium]|jgi:RNA polymerase sigma-70 factor (ECF subfamily)
MTFGIEEISAEPRAHRTPSEEDRDRQLVARFQAGDATAFDEVVEVHQHRLMRLVYRLLGWSDEAEDVLQEVFVSMLENLQSFRGEAKFSTWLTTIAINECRSFQRRRAIRWRSFVRLARRHTTVEQKSQRTCPSDEHEEVRRAVSQLSPTYREPIVLRYFEEFSVQEIADVLRLSVNAAEVRLTRARQRLKSILGGRLEG